MFLIAQELGVPVMEIFVRRNAADRLHRQACVVKADRNASGDGADGVQDPRAMLDAADDGDDSPRSMGTHWVVWMMTLIWYSSILDRQLHGHDAFFEI